MQNVTNEFEFSAFKIALNRTKISFFYKGIYSSSKSEIFEEKILLPSPIPPEIPNQLLDKVLFSLHLILGISYYKMFSTSNIRVKSGELNKAQADFWNAVYTKGLGEFFYRNSIDFRGLIKFPYSQNVEKSSTILERSNRSLLGIGGGKDSLVSFELLQKLKKDFTSLVIESNHSYPTIDRMMNFFRYPTIKIKRQIDTRVFEKNKRRNIPNGHIPISAINAFIGVFTCLIYNYKYFIVSNEKSANFGNTKYLGLEVNHQWSKSIEFEKLFQTYIKDFITPSVAYFSFLRPFSEFAIIKMFSSYPQYFPYFSSCNTNYKVEYITHSRIWCNRCPKCAFIFGMLAAFLPKKTVLTIFNSNLFQDATLSTLYRQLWGIQDIKPFECVGIPEEINMAFYLSYKNGDYKNDVIMKLFEKEVLSKISKPDQLISNLFIKEDTNTIPKEFRSIVSQIHI